MKKVYQTIVDSMKINKLNDERYWMCIEKRENTTFK